MYDSTVKGEQLPQVLAGVQALAGEHNYAGVGVLHNAKMEILLKGCGRLGE